MPRHAVAVARGARRRFAFRCTTVLTAATAAAAVVGIVTSGGPATAGTSTTDVQTAARAQWHGASSGQHDGGRHSGTRLPDVSWRHGSAERQGDVRRSAESRQASTGTRDGSPATASTKASTKASAVARSAPASPARTGSSATGTAGAATQSPSAATQDTAAATPAGGTPATAAGNGPLGVPGSWSLAFDDEFDGTALDTNRWSANDGDHMNDVTTRASNVQVTDGNLVLTLSSSSTGAYINSGKYAGAGSGFMLPVGGYAEARVNLPGNGSTVYNWPAWWISSGPAWPAGGEHDIVEGLGTATVNYHNSTGAHNFGTIPGTWTNSFHIYGIYRAADHADVYWDGKLVKSYPTSDNGAGQALVLNVGNGSYGGPTVTGTASQVKVDYVRAWLPAR